MAEVVVVDPYIDEINEKFGVLNNNFSDALNGADAVVLMTAHDDFKSIDFNEVHNLMKTPIVIDGRRIYDPDELRDMGFHYKGVGAINTL